MKNLGPFIACLVRCLRFVRCLLCRDNSSNQGSDQGGQSPVSRLLQAFVCVVICVSAWLAIQEWSLSLIQAPTPVMEGESKMICGDSFAGCATSIAVIDRGQSSGSWSFSKEARPTSIYSQPTCQICEKHQKSGTTLSGVRMSGIFGQELDANCYEKVGPEPFPMPRSMQPRPSRSQSLPNTFHAGAFGVFQA